MVLLQLFQNLNKNKNISATPFKLPIEYVSHSVINNTIQNDLEMNHDKSIYEHIFNSVSSNDPVNERNSLLEKWTKYYTTDQSFLKDTQKIIKRFNHFFPVYHSTKFMKEYLEFKEETSFIDKYQYIGFDILKPLNYSPLFLHCLSLYNLSSPIISLLSPLFILIIPFFIIRIKGISINIETYISHLKLSLGRNGIFNLFTNFNQISSQQRISGLFTFVFYVIQIYSNIVSCFKFYKNIHLITEFLSKYKKNLKFFIDMIDTLENSMTNYKSYSKFVNDIKERKKSIFSLYNRLNTIIDSKNTMIKISQIGLIMNLYYEIFMDDIHHQNMMYLFQLGDYICDMRELCTLVKNKKIRKCKFGNTTKIIDGYYLPHIKENYKTNNMKLSKQILITGPNAAGKTTTIKSLLINTILSQQIGYGCYKSAVISPYDYFHSYLNIPDTSGRDSLFQAEARRCKDILECITNNLDKKHLCIFDEIYSGTNPNDAVMCAKLYLKYMNKQSNVNYIITTHYIQLCEFFENDSNVVNMKMDVKETEDKIVYLYKLVNGISYVHGGKYVLKQLDYPKYLFH